MKNLKQTIFVTLFSVFMFSGPLCQAEQKNPSQSVEERNKLIVLRYFQDVLDGKQFDIMNELFTKRCCDAQTRGRLVRA